MTKSVVLPYLRVMLMVIIITGGINDLIRQFVSSAVFLATGFWVSYGAQRVFPDINRVSALQHAFKGVVMCVCWPLIPDWRKKH